VSPDNCMPKIRQASVCDGIDGEVLRTWGRVLPAVQDAPTKSPRVPDRLTRTTGNSSSTASTGSLMSLLNMRG
jgi:hypothetical protein